MDRVTALIERFFPSSGAELSVGGVGIAALANEYGTPFFVYDRGVIDKKWSLLREALPPAFLSATR